MAHIKLCPRDWTMRRCREGMNNLCSTHRCPFRTIFIDDNQYRLERETLLNRGIPDSHVKMHILRSRAIEILEDLPDITYSIYLYGPGSTNNPDWRKLITWQRSLTDYQKAVNLTNTMGESGEPVLLVDDLSGTVIVSYPQNIVEGGEENSR